MLGFGKGKKKVKSKDIQKEGKKEGEKQKNINEPKFHVFVFKTLGRDVPQEIVSFYASQERDSSNSMYLVNKENNFREPLGISKDESIEELRYKLNLKNKTVPDQQKEIKTAIQNQEKKIRETRKGLVDVEVEVEVVNEETGKKELVTQKEPKKVNIIDEEKYLKQLKVIYYLINHSEEGSYDSIDGQGYRQRFYLYDEGALIPIFWDRKTVSLYTAIDSRVKFYRSDQDMVNQDYVDENKDTWMQIGKGLVIFFFVIITIGNIWLFGNNLDRSGELDEKAQAITDAITNSAFGQCIGTIAQTNDELRVIIDEYRAELNGTAETIINDVTTDLR